MGKDSKSCKQPSHQLLKCQAKNRVEDIQSMLNELQVARKESRTGDAATLEEQVNQILNEWKAELNEPTPASSLLEDSFGSFSKELGQLLQQFEVEDDATSPLTAPSSARNGDSVHAPALSGSLRDEEIRYLNHVTQQQSSQGYTPQQHEFIGPELHVSQRHGFPVFDSHISQQKFPGFGNHGIQNHILQPQDYQGLEDCNGAVNSMQGRLINNFEASGLHNMLPNNFEMTTQLDFLHLDKHENLDSEVFINASGIEHWGLDDISDFSNMFPNVNPPPAAFLGPKCALWDCARPAQGSEYCKNYCSGYHADLAMKECPPGTSPILRPGGIGLKDGPIFAALKSKLEGKNVGIPECIGAATSKSPWNTPELFNISILEGEKVREWLFFDKPRRAFETGNRKQRSLPDHEGRGWHESRKQIMKEYGGQKRSYYADPQPHKDLEWHLFEYEMDSCNVCALYRLELKVADERKRSPKTKGTTDPLLDLQKRMGRLTAEVSAENKRSGKGKAKFDEKSDH
ncbi:unnamed protein product [Amaranthus hypochondriacus]